MKRFFAFLMTAILLAISCFGAMAEGAMTKIVPDMELKVSKPANTANNPVIEGENPFTGLPASNEPYTPIFVVLNNVKEAYPHYGIGAADMIFQVPNMSAGNMKLAALFANEYPELCGGTRSARMTMVPFALALDAAFASAGTGPNPNDWADAPADINVTTYLASTGFKSTGTGQKYFNLLGNSYHKSISGFNICQLNEVHKKLAADGTTFEKRPFLFTDEALDRGDEATEIDCKFYENKDTSHSNPASNCTFYYDNGNYVRVSASGMNVDRDSQEALTFTNVIVMRVQLKWKEGYMYYPKHLVGGGQIEVFQNGRHITGSWYREDQNSRLIFLDENGNELTFQRGKSYVIVDNQNAVISYGD